MDTLVAVGTTAAWAYSVFVTLCPGRHPRGRPASRDVLRHLDDHHRPDPARALARGPREGPARRARSGASSGSRRRPPADPRRRRPGRRARGRPARRPAPRPPRREGPGRRRRRRGRLGGRRVDAHRRADAGRRGGRRRGHRRHAQHDRARSSCAPRASARDTALARIVDLVQRAQGSKAPIQRLADRISEIFVPAVLLSRPLTFVAWFVARARAAAHARADRVHRRRDHRLPVRDGPGHADGDHGRHRPGRRGRGS